MANPKDADPIEKAWRYHVSADTLLAGRVQTQLISQAFLIAAFVQMAGSANWKNDPLTFVVVGLGSAVAIFFFVANLRLFNGIEALKEHLKKDSIYKEYLGAARRGNVDNSWPARAVSVWLPLGMLVFWIGALGRLTGFFPVATL